MGTTKITLELLQQACSPGGASVLTAVTELVPAAGPHAGVAPARFVRGSNAAYAFEKRFDITPEGVGEPVNAVVIDTKGSSLNRIEEQLSLAIQDGHPVLAKTPRIQVAYENRPIFTCLDLPHRFSDGHIRAGHIDGTPVTDDPRYRAARDSTAANARALLELSPASIVFGSWDSTRRSHQVRFRSALVGEIIGILADQSESTPQVPYRGAARTDSLSPSVKLAGPDMEKVLAQQEKELSAGNAEGIRKAISKAGKKPVSGAALGLGSIPPSLDGLGVVSCRRIIRSHVLSFSALRQLRFGLGVEGDATVRALLAAFALNGLTRSYSELLLRANCDLREQDRATLTLDARYGNAIELADLSIEQADQLLEEAVNAATGLGIRWEGQVFAVTGNPLIAGGIVADADDDKESDD